jgi:hypothetical protein
MPAATNLYSVSGGPERVRNKITLIDQTHLAAVTEAAPYHAAKTNVWERKL